MFDSVSWQVSWELDEPVDVRVESTGVWLKASRFTVYGRVWADPDSGEQSEKVFVSVSGQRIRKDGTLGASTRSARFQFIRSVPVTDPFSELHELPLQVRRAVRDALLRSSRHGSSVAGALVGYGKLEEDSNDHADTVPGVHHGQ